MPRTTQNPRTRIVCVRLTAGEVAVLDLLAKQGKVSLSDALRSLIPRLLVDARRREKSHAKT